MRLPRFLDLVRVPSLLPEPAETSSRSERSCRVVTTEVVCAGRPIYPAAVHVTGTTAEPHLGGAAALLADGRVLIVGGYDPTSGVLASAERYDPGTGRWTATGRMSLARGGPITATRLPDGRVLVTGGWGDTFSGTTNVEIYNPSTGTWSTASPLGTARYHDQAVALTSGRVLVIGGWNDTVRPSQPPSSSTRRPVTGRRPAPCRSRRSRASPPPVCKTDGSSFTGGSSAATSVYDPATNQWTAGPALHVARSGHTATLLADGGVLIAGGVDPSSIVLRSTEIYDPGTGSVDPRAEPRSQTLRPDRHPLA